MRGVIKKIYIKICLFLKKIDLNLCEKENDVLFLVIYNFLFLLLNLPRIYENVMS